ncbi:MAG: hypothetical protein A2156_00660 [Deltaproteobacteria bacterium RBG_16_48_10]|nr:MAG: hypothetical protein A2156_00660 [Deltaproteobacteria bacterium RBG_16_48_10]
MKKSNYNLWSSLVWCLGGLGFFVGGLRLGVGSLSTPGPGFLPSVFGGILSILSIVLFVLTIQVKSKPQGQVKFWKEEKSWKKVLYSLLSLIFYLIFLNYLGYITTTFLFCFYLFKFIGGKGWWVSLLVAILASLVSYIVFDIGMEVPLPKGIIKIG